MNLEKAKMLLNINGHTCVFCDGQTILTDKRRGVRPLLDILESGRDVSGYSVADKVVGKAAAYLYCLLGIKHLYARVISRSALDVLTNALVSVEYDELVPAIRNRTNDGFCPMEQAVWNITDPTKALTAIYDALAKLN
ncbi:MAG: DUF1893 domain-containing protein [Ruminococcaceae bacterium]|nr:DUF1893 domain-containing protein [Oscillospiraceae bacterium]